MRTGLHHGVSTPLDGRPRLRSLDPLWIVLLLFGPVAAAITWWLGVSTARVKVHTDFLKYRDCGSPLLDSAPVGDPECATHMRNLRGVVFVVLAIFLAMLILSVIRVIREARSRRES
jgi:hypothetical protein